MISGGIVCSFKLFFCTRGRAKKSCTDAPLFNRARAGLFSTQDFSVDTSGEMLTFAPQKISSK